MDTAWKLPDNIYDSKIKLSSFILQLPYEDNIKYVWLGIIIIVFLFLTFQVNNEVSKKIGKLASGNIEVRQVAEVHTTMRKDLFFHT